MSFKKVLSFTTFLFSFVPIIVISLIFVFTARTLIVDSEEEILRTLTVSNGGSLNEILVGQIREIKLMSNNNAIKYYVEHQDAITSASLHNSNSALDDAIDTWVDSYKEYQNAIFVSTDGTVVASYNREGIGSYVGDQDFFSVVVDNFRRGKTDETVISDKVKSLLVEDSYSIIMSHPITSNDGELNGVLALHISIDFLKNYIESVNTGYGRTVFIVDRRNKVIFHPDMNFINSKVLSPVLLEKFDFLRNNIDHNILGYDFVTYELDNEKNICSMYLIEESDWILVMSTSWNAVLSPLNMIVFTVLISSIFAMVISIFVGQSISHYYMKPINRLKDTIARVQMENKYLPCEVTSRNEFGELAEGYNMMIKQLSNNEKENYYLAYKDRITGLHNHYAISRELRKSIERQKPFAVLFLDLDNFKTVNELFGHAAGNETLIEFSKILEEVDSIPKIVGRYGGDTFVVIIEGGENQVTNYALKVIDRLKNPIEFGKTSINISSSIGISFYPVNGKSEDELIKHSDMAMHEAKESGKNTLVVYNQMLENQIVRDNKIISIIKDCIISEEIYPVFQPEVDFKTNQVIGFEALMRINSKELGFISPGEFIPVAESRGLIGEVGYWILEKSCLFFKELLDKGYDLKFMSVNLSPIQIMDTHFVNHITRILEKTKLDPCYLQVEVTESLIMKNMENNVKKLSELRNLGITVALDDFGTSYSSLNYLISLPIDTLKIDKSFVDDICTKNKKLVIVRSIINMAHNIGLNVVAEGVETKNQRDLLLDENCDILQGYYYSKPLVSNDVLDLLVKNSNN